MRCLSEEGRRRVESSIEGRQGHEEVLCRQIVKG
jgi:hypothetical protein